MPPRTGVWLFPEASGPEMVRIIQQAERSGLDEVWLGDEGPARDPLSVLAAAATATDRIRLAVGITNPYSRHPVMTAVSMMTINELSAGRAVLGLGVGGNLALAPLGIAPVHPLRTVRSSLETIYAVLHGEANDGYSPPSTALTSPRLPVFIGSRSPLINRMASRRADGAFVAGVPVAQVAEVVAWARSIRPIQIALYVSAAFSTEDLERARPQMVWGLVNSSDATLELTGHSREEFLNATSALQAGDLEPARRLMTDNVLGHVMLWGAPSHIGKRLAALVEELEPDSIGLSLLQADTHKALDDCSAAFEAMRYELRP